MLPSYISYLFLVLKVALGSAKENSSAVEKEPPNEWGPYYDLPAGLQDMTTLFLEAFRNYVDKDDPEFKCREGDADLSRWYVSSKDPDHVILSYYCRTKEVRGYEHLMVSKSMKKVLQYDSSLKTFGIMDAGDYEGEIPEEEGIARIVDLVRNVTDQIKQQKTDTSNPEEVCPDPGTETFYKAQTKTENGLEYYKFAISCNIFDQPGFASHKTDIEIVIDKDFKILNEGKPVLAVMEQPIRNTQFIREKEEEEALKAKTTAAPKPTGSASKYYPIVIAVASILVIVVVAVVIFVLLKKFNFIDIHC